MRGGLVLIVVLSIVTGRAYAQPGDTGELAAQLFDQGLALRKAGPWAEASRRFEDSLRVEAKVPVAHAPGAGLAVLGRF